MIVLLFQDVKANTVVLRSDLENVDLLMYLGEVLQDQGFFLGKMDRDFLTLTTEVLNNYQSEFQIKIRVKGNQAEIQYYTSFMGSSMNIENFKTGQKGSTKRKQLEMFMKYINELEGEKDYLTK